MVDKLDAELIALLAAEPRLGVFEASRRLGVARGTVQARLDRLQRSGVVRDFAPTVDTEQLGFPVTGFVTVELASGEEGRDAAIVEHLRQIPEILEVHRVTGPGDLMVRVAARSNSDLQRVIDRIGGDRAVARTTTVIALTTMIDHRTVPLVQAAVAPDDDRTNEEEHD
ncbi:Lrp/AsnC family transcriptional regulator [Leifsonia shinshuensis]|uniref:Lrp/AsnC family transcriptional regulator n=1 Tax=Leifsonia shinshuensis TaxID=150026 RepID=UPI002858067D|nr:Lrp/AsnC family transcriptional regulator [Leifsonia shinshuensis]MDR6973170.1 DNA-binding Lrp family transcriptional regulator [Leifsonia shinshuensis]